MKALATTVKRSAQSGEVHGQLLLCDFTKEQFELLIELKSENLEGNPRGGRRGFRGVDITKDGRHLILSTFDELQIVDWNGKLISRHTHPALIHAHDVAVSGDTVWVTATFTDYVLEFDLKQKEFIGGYQLFRDDNGHLGARYDQNPQDRGQRHHRLHLNSVYATENGFLTSGAHSGGLIEIQNNQFRTVMPLPVGTHNVSPVSNGFAVLNTEESRFELYQAGEMTWQVDVSKVSDTDLSTPYPPQVARPFFARGLSVGHSHQAVFGFSPTSLCWVDIGKKAVVKTLNLTNDVAWMVSGVQCIDERQLTS